MGLVWRTDASGVDGTGFIAVWQAVLAGTKSEPSGPILQFQDPSPTHQTLQSSHRKPKTASALNPTTVVPVSSRTLATRRLTVIDRYHLGYCSLTVFTSQACQFRIDVGGNATCKLHVWGNTWEGFDVLTVVDVQNNEIQT